MKLRSVIWLSLLAIGLLVYGGWKAFVFFTNWNPKMVALSEFNHAPPLAIWVTLTDATPGLADAVSLETLVLKLDRGIAVPLKPSKSLSKEKAHVVLLTTSDRYKQMITDALQHPQAGPQTQFTGMLLNTFDSDDDKSRSAINQSGIADGDFVFLKEGAQPESEDVLIFGMLMTAAIAVIIYLVRSRLKRPGPPPLPGKPPPLPTA